jgi:CheY-like chemotaxis protein
LINSLEGSPHIKKVLFADDDADERILFESVYQKRRDIILLPSSVNGSDVIKKLNRSHDQDLPDLIILDQNMPLMTGKQTLTFIKSNDRFSKIPVCICSTYADQQLMDDCLKLGAYKVASKPLTDAEYQRMMNDFLSVFDGK